MDQPLSPKCEEFLNEFASKSKWFLPDSIRINIKGIPDFTQRTSETQEQVNELKKQEDENYEI
jgi:hypothetical protein